MGTDQRLRQWSRRGGGRLCRARAFGWSKGDRQREWAGEAKVQTDGLGCRVMGREEKGEMLNLPCDVTRGRR